MLLPISLQARRTRSLACYVLIGVGLPSIAHAASPGSSHAWPGFRGSSGDGISPETGVFTGLERIGLEIVWKRTIGSGYSGVAVAQGHVVTMFSDGRTDFMVDFDEEGGKERWRFEIAPTYVGHDGSHTGPLSTPLIHDGRVFGLHARGRLFALDIESGRQVWSTNLVKEHGAKEPDYGLTTSPILEDGVLVIQLGAKDAAIAGFDPATGKLLWAAGSDTIAYQSPIPLILHGHRQVLATGDKNLYGINARTGEILWEQAHGGGGTRGIASLVPVPAGDGRLFLAYRDNSSALFELQRQDNGVVMKKTWDDRSIRNSYNVPIYHDGHVYAYSSRFLTCVDATTGKSVWRSRQPGDGWLILVDGHLIIITNRGGLHVVKAGPNSYEEVAGLQLFDDFAWSPPSFANGCVIVRSLGEIARVRVGEGTTLAGIEPAAELAPAASKFGRFLTEVNSTSDKKGVVDRFMAANEQFPLVHDDGSVHFVYRGPADDLAIAGDMIGTSLEKPMNRVEGTDFYYYSTRLEPDARVNYLFIKDYEEITDPLNPRKTTTIVLGKDMEIAYTGQEMEMSWVAMPEWKAPTHFDKPEKSRRGRVRPWDFQSEKLGTRIAMEVYLPAGYKDGEGRYPVVYVHGGAFARHRGRWPRSLDNLIGRSVAPVIVVFINNSPWRDTETYATMFAEELIPFIDEQFQTMASPDARASVGMGLSGFAAFLCPLQHPGVVNKVACQSPLLLDAMFDQLEPLPETSDEVPLTVYLEWGKYDLRNSRESWNMGENARRLADIMREKGFTVSGGQVPDGTGWSSWGNRTNVLLEALFPIAPPSKTDG